MPAKLVRLVQTIMVKQAHVQEGFDTDSGVKQGGTLASLYFNLGVDEPVQDSGSRFFTVFHRIVGYTLHTLVILTMSLYLYKQIWR